MFTSTVCHWAPTPPCWSLPIEGNMSTAVPYKTAWQAWECFIAATTLHHLSLQNRYLEYTVPIVHNADKYFQSKSYYWSRTALNIRQKQKSQGKHAFSPSQANSPWSILELALEGLDPKRKRQFPQTHLLRFWHQLIEAHPCLSCAKKMTHKESLNHQDQPNFEPCSIWSRLLLLTSKGSASSLLEEGTLSMASNPPGPHWDNLSTTFLAPCTNPERQVGQGPLTAAVEMNPQGPVQKQNGRASTTAGTRAAASILPFGTSEGAAGSLTHNRVPSQESPDPPPTPAKRKCSLARPFSCPA